MQLQLHVHASLKHIHMPIHMLPGDEARKKGTQQGM